jgi:hypothetical protein
MMHPAGLPFVETGKTIPKVIHQTFPTRSLPVEFSQNVERLKDQNPGWSHVLYDDGDISTFIVEEYGPDILASFDQISPAYGAARADLFRYLLLYKRGGVYLDIKSGINHPLDEVLLPGDQVLLSQWNTRDVIGRAKFGKHKEITLLGGELQQWQIMTIAGHPFLRAVIENVLKNIATYSPWKYGTGGKGVYRVTGPIAYTKAIEPLMSLYPHRLVVDTEVGLIYSAIESSHKKLFKGHYLARTDPIIKGSGLAQLSGWSYDLARRAKRYVGRA